ncbi:F-box /WD repeat-containing protein TBL1X [Fasciola gigantica]|uniref:F-box /WD repeat-containing protein TBL1X n=1 Tax=Fasciola gigantica TaxID=46835 RepID=A0A504YEK0_FASGI|nr:F-box /WD repeat-containing protein TBL1X [Fasciola gigantica]
MSSAGALGVSVLNHFSGNSVNCSPSVVCTSTTSPTVSPVTTTHATTIHKINKNSKPSHSVIPGSIQSRHVAPSMLLSSIQTNGENHGSSVVNHYGTRSDAMDVDRGHLSEVNRASPVPGRQIPSERITDLQGHDLEVFICARNPRSNRLASGSCDPTARIWNLEEPLANPPQVPHLVLTHFVNLDGQTALSNKDATSLD